MTPFTGLFVATLTPFDAADRLDYGVLRTHAQYLVEAGARGLCPAGTTGEFLYLTLGEKVRAVEETARAVDRRAKVIAGVWSVAPKEIALLARAAQDAGADAVFLPPPIYYPAAEETVYQHYAAVRAATSLPVFAYNIPAYAANAVTVECLERMVNDGVVEGIKDSTGKADRMRELIERFGGRIAVEAASDSFATEGRKLGAHGFISALANIWPRAFGRLWDGDESVQPAVDAARTAVKKAGGIPALKHLTARQGFAFGHSRLPFSGLSDAQRAMLDEAFNAAKAAGMV